MLNNLVKKGLAFGIIILFIGTVVVPCMGLTFIKDFQNEDFIEEESLNIKKDDEVFKDGKNQRITKPELLFNESKNIFSNKEPQRCLPSNHSTTLYVGGSGPNNYTKIQDAINDASDGDTVFVYNDSIPYYEHIIINKSINLIGEDKDTTIIAAKSKGVSLNGLAYDPISHKLYGASSYSLYEVDMDSSHQTYIGDFNTGGLMIGISFDNIGNCYGIDLGTDSLYSIDTDTGEASLIGSFGINLNYAQDCAYDRDNDIFYLSAYNVGTDDRGAVDERASSELRSYGGELYICDTETAKLKLLGAFENGAEITGFAIPYEQEKTLEKRFDINSLKNKVNVHESRFEPFYGYCAYDPTWQMWDYTIYFNSKNPENLTTIAYKQSDDFIAGADWVNDTWYGVEYGTGRLYTIDHTTGDMNAVGYDGDVISIFADWVNISGFKIINGVDGILVYSNYSTITGNNINSNTNNGIHLKDSSNNTITNNNVTSNGEYGIGIYYSNSNIVTGNNIISNDEDGIHLYYSKYNFIINNSVHFSEIDGISLYYSSTNNTIVGNNISSSFRWDGIYLDDSDYNTVDGNTIIDTNAGIRIYYAINNNITNNVASNNIYGINLHYSSGNNITGNNISNNGGGIHLERSSDNIITSNNISNNSYGIHLVRSSDNIITGNNINSNKKNGIYLDDSNGNNITGNTISNNVDGFHLLYSISNTIINNTISNNWGDGIILYYSCSNIIKSNSILNNSNGIYFYFHSYNNFIYHNNFINNIQNAYDICYNTWDDGKYGNYWDDYKERYLDAKKKPFKDIWDTPYEIPGGDNKDNYPLINQWPKPRTRTITRNMATFNNLLHWFLERFSNVLLALKHLISQY